MNVFTINRMSYFLLVLLMFNLSSPAYAVNWLNVTGISSSELNSMAEKLVDTDVNKCQSCQVIAHGKLIECMLRENRNQIISLQGYDSKFLVDCCIPIYDGTVNNFSCTVDFDKIKHSIKIGPDEIHSPHGGYINPRKNDEFFSKVFVDWGQSKPLYLFKTGLFWGQNIAPPLILPGTIDPSNQSGTTDPNGTAIDIDRAVTATKSLTKSLLPANWHMITGIYQDATDQTGRYKLRDGVVTDNYSNLQWQQTRSASNMPHSEAISYCGSQTTGGYNDWRLPSVCELTSLVDFTISYTPGPGINAVAFPATPPEYFWTNQQVVGNNSSKSWVVNFGAYSGSSSNRSDTTSLYVRCASGDSDNLSDRYTNIANGIVRDHLTGLEWEQADNSGKIFSSAMKYCGYKMTGGQYDWRLPNIKELETIVDYSVAPGNPIIDPVFNGLATQYWSNTSVSGSSGNAWVVNFYNGNVEQSDKDCIYRFRCVRSPTFVAQTTPPATSILTANWLAETGVYQDATDQMNRYGINNNGVITDNYSKLQWQEAHSASSMTHSNAVSYCTSQTTGGYSDWRLPTVQELESLVDFTISYTPGPGINAIAFPGTTVGEFWTSQQKEGNPGYFWYIKFGSYSGDNHYMSSGIRYVRCVRGDGSSEVGRYTDLDNGIVKDNLTGLEWEQVGSAKGYSQSGATSYCSGRTTGSRNDWRIPNIKELQTLYDYTTSSSLKMHPVFSSYLDYPKYWSNTGVSGYGSKGWYGPNVGYDFSSYSRKARCVRTPTEGAATVAPTVAPATFDPGVPTANWLATTGVYQDVTDQAGRYTVNNGVVTDSYSNLQWQQTNSDSSKSHSDAISYCSSQTTGGVNDWRLPTVKELESLVDFTVYYSSSYPGAGINEEIFLGTPAANFWSSQQLSGDPSRAWYVRFSSGSYAGYSSYALNTTNYSIRCVCGDSSDLGSYTNLGNGTVKDDRTGLEWEQDYSSSLFSRSNAVNYCSGRTTDNKNDWRLPKVKELHTLFNYSGAIDSVFSGGTSEHWTNTYRNDGTSYGWRIYFSPSSGYVGYDFAGGVNRVRCVRDGS